MLAKANFRGGGRDLGHQRVRVSVDFRLLIPIRIFVFLELLTLGNYVHEGAVPAMPAFVGGEAVEQRLARGLLQIHIERGVDAQSARMNLIAAILRF